MRVLPPTKRAWLTAWLDGLERSAFSGVVSLTVHLDGGSIARLIVNEESKAK